MNYTSELLPALIAVVAGVAAFYLADNFRQAGRRRTLACLIETPCPHCSKTYGIDLLTTVSQVSYRWTPLPGNTAASLGLPRATFLATCPSCAAQNEFHANGRLFVHAQTGVLDFTRQIKSLADLRFVPSESIGQALLKSAHPAHAPSPAR